MAVLAHVAKQFVQLRVSQRGGARAEAATVVRVRIGLDRADLLAQMGLIAPQSLVTWLEEGFGFGFGIG